MTTLQVVFSPSLPPSLPPLPPSLPPYPPSHPTLPSPHLPTLPTRPRSIVKCPIPLTRKPNFFIICLQGTISIGAGSQFEYLPDTKGRPHRFRLLDSQTQVPYEICTPDSDSLQLWNNAIKIVRHRLYCWCTHVHVHVHVHVCDWYICVFA